MALPTSILCPVDFSAHAERALRHAVALASAFHARLTVLTVNDPLLVEATAAAGHSATLRSQVSGALQEALARVPAPSGPVIPVIDIVTGAAADEILLAADRAGAELVVMGTKGLGGTSKLMFGSTTERVMHTTRVPVLAVPEYTPERYSVENGATRFTVHTVVAAVGLDALDEAVAGAAAEWAIATGATLLLTHVCHEAPAPSWWPFAGSPVPSGSIDAAREQVAALSSTLPAAATTAVDVRSGTVASGVASVAREHSAGLLVVSRGSGEHRLGAVAYRLMREADIPTLVVAGR